MPTRRPTRASSGWQCRGQRRSESPGREAPAGQAARSGSGRIRVSGFDASSFDPQLLRAALSEQSRWPEHQDENEDAEIDELLHRRGNEISAERFRQPDDEASGQGARNAAQSAENDDDEGDEGKIEPDGRIDVE